MKTIAKIAVEKAACRFDKLYDYRIPEGMAVIPGMRVMVPFGRGQRRVGLVVETADAPTGDIPLKNIAALPEDEPILNEEGLWLLRWLKENTFCTWFDALSVLIPAGYGLRGLTAWSLIRGADAPEDLEPAAQQVLDYLRPRRRPAATHEIAEALDRKSVV